MKGVLAPYTQKGAQREQLIVPPAAVRAVTCLANNVLTAAEIMVC